jgi:hypothetical protein
VLEISPIRQGRPRDRHRTSARRLAILAILVVPPPRWSPSPYGAVPPLAMARHHPPDGQQTSLPQYISVCTCVCILEHLFLSLRDPYTALLGSDPRLPLE